MHIDNHIWYVHVHNYAQLNQRDFLNDNNYDPQSMIFCWQQTLNNTVNSHGYTNILYIHAIVDQRSGCK